jgi:hypothetical protein
MASPQVASLSAKYVAAVFALPLALMAVLQLYVPYLNELFTHMVDAHLIWQREIDVAAIYRMPLGYAGYISPFVTALGEIPGVKTANMLALLAMLSAALAFLVTARRTAGAAAEAAEPRLPFGLTIDQAVVALMAFALTFYPYTIFNVARTNEAVPAAALLILFTWALLQKPTIGYVILVAVCLGAGTHVRANLFSLLLPAYVWLALRSDESWARRGLLGLLAFALALAAYAACSLLFSGHLWYTPSNGGYNLYAGYNPLAFERLLYHQNGEYSLIPALATLGITITDAFHFPPETYMALAKDYALSHPVEVVKLAAMKAMVLFSPRLTSADNAAEIIVQSALALTTLATLGVAAWRFARTRGYLDGMLLLVVAAYALPFIAINADPRLRYPIDMLVLCYLIFSLGECYRQRRARMSAAG